MTHYGLDGQQENDDLDAAYVFFVSICYDLFYNNFLSGCSETETHKLVSYRKFHNSETIKITESCEI